MEDFISKIPPLGESKGVVEIKVDESQKLVPKRVTIEYELSKNIEDISEENEEN